MEMDTEIVKDIVDQAEQEYLERTILSDSLLREYAKSTRKKECSTSPAYPIENFSLHTHPIQITKRIDEVVKCEKQHVLDDFEEQAQEAESIDEDNIVGDLLHLVDGSGSLPKLYLPNKPGLRTALEIQGFQETIGANWNAPIEWIEPEFIGEQTGYLINDCIFVEQTRQEDTPITSGEIEVEDLQDCSDNRLRMHIRRVPGGKLEVYFGSEFSEVQNRGGNGTITHLNVPDSDSLQ
jgi:hypothetical protein